MNIHWRFAAFGGLVLLIFDILLDGLFVLASQIYGPQQVASYFWLYRTQTFVIACALGLVAVRREYPPFQNVCVAAVCARLWSVPYNVPLLVFIRHLSAGETCRVFFIASLQTVAAAMVAGACVTWLERPVLRVLVRRIKPASPAPPRSRRPSESTTTSAVSKPSHV